MRLPNQSSNTEQAGVRKIVFGDGELLPSQQHIAVTEAISQNNLPRGRAFMFGPAADPVVCYCCFFVGAPLYILCNKNPCNAPCPQESITYIDVGGVP